MHALRHKGVELNRRPRGSAPAGDPAANFTGRQTEFRGYQTGAGVTHEHGFGPNDAGKINEFITNHYDPNYLINQYFPNNDNFPQ